MTYRIFINHEDPKSYNDGEKIVVNEVVPTLRDARRLVALLGLKATDTTICKKVCMLASAIKEGARRAELAHEKFPITLLYDDVEIKVYEPDEASHPMDNKWFTNVSFVKAVKYILTKHEASMS